MRFRSGNSEAEHFGTAVDSDAQVERSSAALRRWRWMAVRMIAGLLIVAVLVAAGHGLALIALHQEVRAAAAEGLPVGPESFARPGLPPGDNAAIPIRQAISLLGDGEAGELASPDAMAATVDVVNGDVCGFGGSPPTHVVNKSIAKAMLFLHARAPALQLFREASLKPHLDLGMAYSRWPIVSEEEMEGLRRGIDYLLLDGAFALSVDERSQFRSDWTSAARLIRLALESPTPNGPQRWGLELRGLYGLIGRLIQRFSGDRVLIQDLDSVLRAAGEPPLPADFVALGGLYATSLRRAAIEARSGSREFAAWYPADDFELLPYLAAPIAGPLVERSMLALVREEYALVRQSPSDVLKLRERLKTYSIRTQKQWLDRELRKFARPYQPDLVHVGENLALYRCVKVALAACRQRFASGKWPAAVPSQFSDSIDPFGGGRLGYRAESKGVLIWSVGPNRSNRDGSLRTASRDEDLFVQTWQPYRRIGIPGLSENPDGYALFTGADGVVRFKPWQDKRSRAELSRTTPSPVTRTQ